MSGVVTHPVPDTPFTDDVLKHITAVAHKLARKYNRNVQDEEDIRSQFIERLMKAFPKYDPKLSCYYTFAQRVVDCERGHVERKLNQRYREESVTVSLYDRADRRRDDKSRWIDILKSPYGNMEVDLNKIDLCDTVDALDPVGRAIANRYKEGYSWSEIAEEMNLSVPDFFKKVKPLFLKNLRRAYFGPEKRTGKR